MSDNPSSVKRYSELELAEFKALIDQKLERARNELTYYQEQILDIEENFNGDRDGWMEDAMVMNELELLMDLAQRQRKYIRELERALFRIKQKTYGICEVTGELIDKRRLLATPITTKSLEAKISLQQEEEAKKNIKPPVEKRKTTPQIISKVISKKPLDEPKTMSINDDLEDEDEDFDDDPTAFTSLDEIADNFEYEEEE